MSIYTPRPVDTVHIRQTADTPSRDLRMNGRYTLDEVVECVCWETQM